MINARVIRVRNSSIATEDCNKIMMVDCDKNANFYDFPNFSQIYIV